MTEFLNRKIREAAGKGRAVTGVEPEREPAEELKDLDVDQLVERFAEASGELDAILLEMSERLRGVSNRASEEREASTR
jgi:hypothetical protein